MNTPIDSIDQTTVEQAAIPAHGTTTVKPYVYVSVFCSLSIIVGLIWDISWHTTIGRDGLLSPPHDLVYLGAIVCGGFSAWHVLSVTFFGTPAEKEANVKFWGIFYGSLGALFCIWGAIAMLTSAPFDDWWHNTYGLDVVILSPPHTLLAIGIMMIQFGSMVAVLSSLHGSANGNGRIHHWLFITASGLLLATLYGLFSEFLNKSHSHSALCYQVASVIFPLFLVAIIRAARMKWAATATAAVYMAIGLLMLWILPLFPALPRLGPVLNHVDHYQPFHFPLLLIFPAIGMDLVFQNFEHEKPFVEVTLASLVFLLIFFVVQWNFGAFLLTAPAARGWFFGSYSWYFGANPLWPYRYAFHPRNVDQGIALVRGMFMAAIIAIIFGWLGYYWGGWMKKVRR
jgi:hypothetical protein